MENGILQHNYIDASDDIAAYMADQCNRQAVTAKFAFDNLCDEPLYVFLVSSHEVGMDAWITITGMDKLTKHDAYVLDYGTTGEKIVPPDFRLFVSKKTLAKFTKRGE